MGHLVRISNTIVEESGKRMMSPLEKCVGADTAGLWQQLVDGPLAKIKGDQKVKEVSNE